jgi:hypothetical protein
MQREHDDAKLMASGTRQLGIMVMSKIFEMEGERNERYC